MSSATTSRPSVAMTNSVRPNRFPEFGTASGRQNSEDRTSQPLSQTFGNGGTWQASSGIWGSKTIGSGLATTKRDVSRSRGAADDFSDRPSGSGALAASSEADPWGTRTNPWNQPDTTSPSLQSSHSGSTSPSHTRGSIPNISSQTLMEIQNPYQPSRSTLGQSVGLNRVQQKSNLDPSSGAFFTRKPSFVYQENDKEDAGFHAGGDSYEVEMPASRYRGVGSTSRDPSMPPSRASDSGLNGNGHAFVGGHPTFGSIGHTPANSIHSQRQSVSEVPGQFTNTSRFEFSQTEVALNEKFAKFNISREQNNGSSCQTGYPHGMSHSPNNPNFPQSYSQAPAWTEGSKYNSQEAYSNQAFADQGFFNKVQRYGDGGSTSPAASEHRRGINSPKYYSANVTPPAAPEQMFRPSSGRGIPQGHSELDRRLQNMHFAQQAYLYQAQQAAHFQSPYAPIYDCGPQQFRPTYPYQMPIPAFPPAQVIPTRPAKDQDSGAGIRSALLEDFRSNSKTNKRYELKDIHNHVVEFSGDQHGSRFIQSKIETANSDEKEQVFREIQPNVLQLTTDVFGNYVIQKMFEHGNQVQKRVLGEHMKNHVVELSLQTYGCRVVQKALEHVLADQQAELVNELRSDILKLVKDQNGNHVVQKAIERVPTNHIRFVIDIFKGQTHALAVHQYGCRVVQRILEFCKPQDQVAILEELHQCAATLVPDQYGNYVIQHIIKYGRPEDQVKAIKVVQSQILSFSKHKYASNVVEEAIRCASSEQRRSIVSQLTTLSSDGTSTLQSLMKDQFGNYVIQTVLDSLDGDEKAEFLENTKLQLALVKKYNYGKQIVAIEKLILTGKGPSREQNGHGQSRPSAPSRPMPINTNSHSNAATPSLTNGQNSPQSSGVPSANASTIDEANDSVLSGKTAVEFTAKTCPEVVIEAA